MYTLIASFDFIPDSLSSQAPHRLDAGFANFVYTCLCSSLAKNGIVMLDRTREGVWRHMQKPR
jgi:hypothetical protein